MRRFEPIQSRQLFRFPRLMNAKSSDLFSFATDLARTQALVLSKPVQLFGVPPLIDRNVAAAIADEFFSEGRNHRKPPAPTNYHAE